MILINYILNSVRTMVRDGVEGQTKKIFLRSDELVNRSNKKKTNKGLVWTNK